ncbi:uncharacterized protein TRIADDRAFT_23692 [Trichoplax adhaerens]|uniref:Importin subunit alpha n=1 Tax=Trichoplax adhaerens TaxID=10228 RepID=B3RUB5_TRIAD|nr:hypothetical protein TRIADDRAFT_23692 [Trichoplax adhaerens]EDV25305.1 hypothetical protein TRIADDRAFT_23692 [Trichoplax adhaerens]|eukprot:XP_002111338.1 hypothetical protein TRIADDRAFT_23692 [Trichoplax adhaerens]
MEPGTRGNRIQTYKHKGKDKQELRRRRVDVKIELRKNKRSEEIAKRRNVPVDDEIDEEDDRALEVTLINLISRAKNSDPNVQLEAVQAIRKLLSKDKSPPIDHIVNTGVVTTLVNCLERNDSPSLQFEAAWALTNIASGTSEQTRAVVQFGAVPHFIALLSSSYTDVCEQAVWALGNIIGDGSELRDYVLSQGLLTPLLKFVSPNVSLSFLRNVTWVLVNLCRSKDPPPSLEIVLQILGALVALIHHNDLDILIDCVWALSYLTDGSKQQVQAVINTSIVPTLIGFMGAKEIKLQTAALRAVGNIVTGTDYHTQIVLDNGALNHFQNLLTHSKEKVKKEAMWFLSNVTAGIPKQIHMVIEAGLVPLIINCLANADFQTRKEAAWAVSNLAVNGEAEHISLMVADGVITPMCEMLTIKDIQIVHVLLDGILNILKALPNDIGNITIIIEECGGLTKIEELQNSENTEISKLSSEIIDKYLATVNNYPSLELTIFGS